MISKSGSGSEGFICLNKDTMNRGLKRKKEFRWTASSCQKEEVSFSIKIWIKIRFHKKIVNTIFEPHDGIYSIKYLKLVPSKIPC